MKRYMKLVLALAAGLFVTGCYNDFDNPAPAKVYTDQDFTEAGAKIISIKELKQYFYNKWGNSANGLGRRVEISDNVVIKGKVISSDAEGNVYAKRIGTLSYRFPQSTDGWVNDFTLDIEYGDISSRGDLNEIERLTVDNPYYTKNSKGEVMPIHEVGWGDAGDKPTHVVLRFSSSHGGAYIGSVGNTLWIDNVRFVY